MSRHKTESIACSIPQSSRFEERVAMLIFAIAIVSIFGAQFSAISTTEFARHTTMATELARCRMSELELEFLARFGEIARRFRS